MVATALRVRRPPQTIGVAFVDSLPARVFWDGQHYAVREIAGPWRPSSQCRDKAAQLLAHGDCETKMRAVRACSAASRKRYHVDNGTRMMCCGRTSLISSTMAAKPHARSNRSVAFNACPSLDHGLSASRSRRSGDIRSHSRRFSTMLAAAADSGESASLTSTQAQAAPDCVIAAMDESANDVFPVEAAPATSVMLPRGMPQKRWTLQLPQIDPLPRIPRAANTSITKVNLRAWSSR